MRDRPPHVLVAYGSERGGTREIAAVIEEVLLNEGVDADLADATQVESIAEYDAVIVGGALYMNRWHRDARRFIKRHAAALRARPVWMFSSGPLDATANERPVAPTHSVEHLADLIDARDHVTFGGRLEPDAKGFPASAMAKHHAGDWREWHQIRAWATALAHTLHTEEPPAPIEVEHTPSRGQRWLLAALCFFVGVTAIGGGATLALRPDGSLMEAPMSMLRHSPFESFLVPGLLLLLVIGIGSLVAGALIARQHHYAPHAAFFAGSALLVWIVTEMIMLRSHHWLQVGYLTAAIVILVEAWQAFELPWRHGRAARYAPR
jgi:menaquinone-dependent protoporphyrinogen oxidase